MFSLPHRILFALLLAWASASGCAQTPKGFRWLDFKRDRADLARVTSALQAERYTAIREVGIEGEFALAFTVFRDRDTSIPERGDLWTVYSIPMRSGSASKVVSGAHLEMLEWLRFEPSGSEDLLTAYYNCWECEADRFLAVFHLDAKRGWRVRWPDNGDPEHPGVFLHNGLTEDFGDDDEDQVWAVVEPSAGARVAMLGTWMHARERQTGKVTDTVMRYSVDPASGKDRTEELTLTGPATAWKRKLCASQALPLAGGQDTASCKRLLKAPAARTSPAGTKAASP